MGQDAARSVPGIPSPGVGTRALGERLECVDPPQNSACVLDVDQYPTAIFGSALPDQSAFDTS